MANLPHDTMLECPPQSRGNRPLFQISNDIDDLEHLLLELGGEITSEEQEDIIDEWFEALGEERDTKVDKYCKLIRVNRQLGEDRLEEGKRIIDLGKVNNNLADRLENRLYVFMQVRKIKNLETPNFKLLVAGNGGVTPIVYTETARNNPEMLPAKYVRTSYSIDGERFRADLDYLKTIDMRIASASESEADADHIIALKAESAELHSLLDPIGSFVDRGTHLRIK